MQESYAAENNAVGTWAQIGYKGSGFQAINTSVSSAFTYAQGTAGAGTWVATTTVDLNDCHANAHWDVTTQYDSSNVVTTISISDLTNCKAPLPPISAR